MQTITPLQGTYPPDGVFINIHVRAHIHTHVRACACVFMCLCSHIVTGLFVYASIRTIHYYLSFETWYREKTLHSWKWWGVIMTASVMTNVLIIMAGVFFILHMHAYKLSVKPYKTNKQTNKQKQNTTKQKSCDLFTLFFLSSSLSRSLADCWAPLSH